MEVMFRNYPLTWLFIIATVSVDLAVLLAAERGADGSSAAGVWFYVWNYALPAQFGALALWAVYGATHRLAKGAWVTLAFGFLLVLTWYTVEGPYRAESVAFNFIQIFVVVCGAAFFKLCRIVSQPARHNESFQFSLIEIFGWTMIVALWAFAVRFASTGFLLDGYWALWIATATMAPLMLIPVLFSNSSPVARLVKLVGLYLLSFLAYVVGSRYMQGPLPLWAFSMAITQTTYISAWWAVVRMDEVMQERRAVTVASREELALYEPTKSDDMQNTPSP
jgi:hypothetical protein